MSTLATVFVCWIALLILVWPMFVAAGRADDAMESWANRTVRRRDVSLEGSRPHTRAARS